MISPRASRPKRPKPSHDLHSRPEPGPRPEPEPSRPDLRRMTLIAIARLGAPPDHTRRFRREWAARARYRRPTYRCYTLIFPRDVEPNLPTKSSSTPQVSLKEGGLGSRCISTQATRGRTNTSSTGPGAERADRKGNRWASSVGAPRCAPCLSDSDLQGRRHRRRVRGVGGYPKVDDRESP